MKKFINAVTAKCRPKKVSNRVYELFKNDQKYAVFANATQSFSINSLKINYQT